MISLQTQKQLIIPFGSGKDGALTGVDGGCPDVFGDLILIQFQVVRDPVIKVRLAKIYEGLTRGNTSHEEDKECELELHLED